MTWMQNTTTSTFETVNARLFDEACRPLSPPFPVATGQIRRGISHATVARNDNGFVVAWSADENVPERAFPRYATFLRLYASDSRTLSDIIRMDSSGLFADATSPKVAVYPLGRLVVTYSGWDRSSLLNGMCHLMLRYFDSSGQAIGKEFEVPYDTMAQPSNTALGIDGEGNTLVVWDGTARWIMNPSPGLPDLRAEGITAPREPVAPGVPQEVTTTFWDYGVTPAQAAMRYTLSADPILGNEDDRPLLAPDSSVSWPYGGFRATDHRDFTLPSDLSLGTWWLFAQVDPEQQLAELDRTNNTVSTTIQVSHPSVQTLGHESVVNTYKLGDQTTPAVAMAQDGGYVVVWSGQGPDNNAFGYSVGIFGQRYDALGIPIGSQFRVSRKSDPSLSDKQVDPAITMDNSGRLAVMWADSHRQGGTSTVWDVCGRLYDPSGTPMGGEFTLNGDATEGDQTMPGVGIDATGQIIAVWLDSTGCIYRRRFDASGAPLGPSVRLEQSTGATSAAHPQVVMAPDGRYVVVWGIIGSATPSCCAQWFAADDSPQGDRFGIPAPSVATGPQGKLAVVYSQLSLDGTLGVYTRFLAADGTMLTDPVKVNSCEGNYHDAPSPCIAFDGNGYGVVAWRRTLWTGTSRMIGRRVDLSCQPFGVEFPVSESSSGVGALSMSGNGHFAVVWQFVGTGRDIASRLFALLPN